MNRSLALTLALAWSFAGPAAIADTSSAADVAVRAWAITDAVLARHIDPPARQEMLLAGIKALLGQELNSGPDHLARRVSNLTSADQLASLLTEVWAKARFADIDERDQAFFHGLLAFVDGEPTLLSAKDRKVSESMAANLYVGIQVALGIDEKAKKPAFIQILEGGPAELAGLKQGDLIEAIEGVATEGVPLAKIIDRLRGEEGTSVLIKYRRPTTGEIFEKSLARRRLPHPTIEGRASLPEKRWRVRLDEASPIGYLKITSVSGSTPAELRRFAQQLESEGAKALILDLRQTNSAGLHETILLADALLDGGTIGRVETSDGEKIIQAEPDALFRDWPIVILDDGIATAEVAWLIDALTTNKRATLIGGAVVNADPLIQEIVGLPGGELSVQMATGRLKRGDGTPLLMETRPEKLAAAFPPSAAKLASELSSLLERSNQETLKAQAMMFEVRRKLAEAQKDLTPEVAQELIAKVAESEASSAPRRFWIGQAGGRTMVQPQSLETQLAQARAVLEEAVKSAGK